MRRGSRYNAQRHENWNDNDTSDYSQDDDVQAPSTRYARSGHGESYSTAAMYTRPLPSREKPSGIPRPGGHISRPSSALKSPRSRSSSSTDALTKDENVPPVPQIAHTHTQVRSGIPDIRTTSHNLSNSHVYDRPQPGLSRRSSISCPQSRSYSGTSSMDAENPPPLPDSDHGVHPQATEQTPKRASWAKDRRRFANATPNSTVGAFTDKGSGLLSFESGGARYDQPPTPVATMRRSSLKPPSNVGNSITPTTATPPTASRIPSVSAKPVREAPKTRQTLGHNLESRNGSRDDFPVGSKGMDQISSNVGDPKTPQVVSRCEPSRIRTPNTSRKAGISRYEPAKQPHVESGSISGTTVRSRNGQNFVHPKADPQGAKKAEPIIISSRHDTQLPASPFAQPQDITIHCTPQQGAAESETISSPVETMLIGSAPASQASRSLSSSSASTPVRRTRESSVYMSPAPTASSALSNRRLSEPSPNKGTTSTSPRSPAEKEHAPTILQRLARRASFSTTKSSKTASTSKSPNPSNVSRNRLEVENATEESPFDLEFETPRATMATDGNAGTKAAAPNIHRDLTDRQRDRHNTVHQSTTYLRPSENEPRKPRSKVVEDISGASKDGLGSPFMGDGSPRFGIDERFRSPNKRAKSCLRHNAFEANDDRSQELLEYYGHGIVEPVNTANYYIEGLPIGNVLSSPEDTPVDQTPRGTVPLSPITQSKRRSQYQYTSRVRTCAGGSSIKEKSPWNSMEDSNDNSDNYTPVIRPPSPNLSFEPPPIITRTSVTSLDTSAPSEFSDFSDQESDQLGHLRAEVYREKSGSERGYSGSRTPISVRFASTITQHEPDHRIHRTEGSPSVNTSNAPKSEGLPLKTTTGRHRHGSSQLPVPRQRKTNSALFRALEQPYDSSSSTTVASLESSATGRSNSSSEARTNSDYAVTGASMEGLHTVSSISSSLDGTGVGDIRWSDAQELSGAAEALFHSIERSHSGQGAESIATDSNDESRSSIIGGSTYEVDDENDDCDYISRRNSLLCGSDGHQGDDCGKQRRMSIQDKRKAIHESWRASLEEDQFRRLEETYDPMEMHRQELIWELHESEKAFVDTLRVVVHLFVQPLRAQDQRRWIIGLSPDIMKLFDWLDDITNLHEQLLDALEAMRRDHERVIIIFSETIQPLIPLMELYQPYVVRVEETNKQIASMTIDPQSDFGEFVRIQSALPECELSLEEMVEMPLSRLREYVTFFQTLLTLTPRTHPDHFSCFSLLHSMHAVVCVLDEVKAREEEYELIKSLLNRVHGLPSQFTVATRENRLLAQGPLTRVYVHGDGQPVERATPSRKPGGFATGGSRSRSNSQSTATSAAYSTTSCHSTSSSSTRLKDSSTEYSMRSDSSVTSGANIPYEDHRKMKPGIVTQNNGSRTPGLRPRTPGANKLEEMEIYALVFTDYIVLTKGVMGDPGSRSSRKHTNERWTTLECLGVFRLLGVIDYRGRYGYDYLISLDLVPIGDTGLESTDAPVFVDVPHHARNALGDGQDLHKTRQQWFRFFQQSYLHALRSVSFSLQSDDNLSNPDRLGLPCSTGERFPKSPSQQLEYKARRKEARQSPISCMEEEREERDFWAERFKIVSREMKGVYEGVSRPLTSEPPNVRLSQPSRIRRFRSSGTFI